MTERGDEGGAADLGPRPDSVTVGSDEEAERDGVPSPTPDGPSGSGEGGRQGSFLNDVLTSILAVLGIGILLFAISGVWPPMVAIESPSMAPNINTGDLVFVMEEHRFPGAAQTRTTGVVTARDGAEVGYRTFGRPGDVIVFAPEGNWRTTPIIHRAIFWVNESENWYGKADPQYLPEGATSCADLAQCPAPNRGFITRGDNNPLYDQTERLGAVERPVRPRWVIGTAEFRLPGLGRLRLRAQAAAAG
ncbi:MAG: S26 family signal peptidase [Halorientalis sp.]